MLNKTYEEIIKQHIVYPVFKLQQLYEDESVYSDSPTEDIIDSNGSLNINLKNGMRRTASIDLINLKGKWILNPNGDFWIRTKFKLLLGVKADRDSEPIFFENGVFLVNNPAMKSDNSNQTTSLYLVDKFALMDDTLSGTLSDDYSISTGTSVANAIIDLIKLSNDPILPCIDNIFFSTYTKSEIRKNAGDKISDFLKDLSDAYNFSYYYDGGGRFIVKDAIADLDDSIKPSIYDYDTEQINYLGSNITCKTSEIYNMVQVTGSNANGFSCIGKVANNNGASPFCVNYLGERLKVINNNLIATNADAFNAAQVALKQYSIIGKDIVLNSTYMCHLDVNNVITAKDLNMGLDRDRFLIKQITVPLSSGSKITINASNTNELKF